MLWPDLGCLRNLHVLNGSIFAILHSRVNLLLCDEQILLLLDWLYEVLHGQTASWPLTYGPRSPADGRETDIQPASSLFLMLMQLFYLLHSLSLAVVLCALIDGPEASWWCPHTHTHTHDHKRVPISWNKIIWRILCWDKLEELLNIYWSFLYPLKNNNLILMEPDLYSISIIVSY